MSVLSTKQFIAVVLGLSLLGLTGFGCNKPIETQMEQTTSPTTSIPSDPTPTKSDSADNAMMEKEEEKDGINEAMEKEMDDSMEDKKEDTSIPEEDSSAPTTPPPANETTPEPTPEPTPTPEPEPAPQPTVKTFNITAKQWDFVPAVITVNEGDTVRLNVTSVDVAHGIGILTFGASTRLEPGETATLEFVADKKGTFSMVCTVFCGSGHGSMKGSIIVQ